MTKMTKIYSVVQGHKRVHSGLLWHWQLEMPFLSSNSPGIISATINKHALSELFDQDVDINTSLQQNIPSAKKKDQVQGTQAL